MATKRAAVGPGTYVVTLVGPGTTENVVVPTLTVSIVQSAPTVGQTLTLTTNAAFGAAYQWRRGGTPISGATSATYTTVSADAGQVLTCRVVSGVQDVTSAGVTVGAAAPAFAAAFVAGSYRNDESEFVTSKSFPGVAIGAAATDRVLWVYMWNSGDPTATTTMTVNGGAAISPFASIRPSGAFQVLLYQVSVPAGTTADFVFSNAGGLNINGVSMAVIRVVGTHAAATATLQFNGGDGGPIPAAINTLAGDTVFIGIMSRQGAAVPYFTPPAGFTEHVDQLLRPSGPSFTLFLGSGPAAGGTPETFNVTTGQFAESSILTLRLRAA
jgi:hypothetical protein